MAKEAKQGYKKNLGTILLLAFAGSIIYGLPYFRSYYYDTYQSMYNLTNTQMGLLGSAYGLLGVFSYVIGGVLADKIKAKKLLIFSMIATGFGGLLHLVVSDFYALAAIYGLWGVTSLLTFWPALMKIVRIQATDEEQSRAYGIFEGGRGVFNAAHLAVATAIFGVFEARTMPYMGIDAIIWFYSLAPLIVGIIFIFILKEPDTVGETASQQVSLKQILSVLKMPVMWLIIIMIYTSYTFNMSSYYFTPYASNIIGVTAVIAAILTVMSQYIRPFAATIGGFAGDKVGKSKTMIVGYILMVAGVIIMDMTGRMSSDSRMILVVVACVLVYAGMFSNFGLYFSFISEAGIPVELGGVAIGMASTFGYLPEVLSYTIAGKLLDTYPGYQGYHLNHMYMIAMGIIGLIVAIIWTKKYAKKKTAES
uniref:MFS transporter n=1 Tax=Lachnoclostridium phocaeense TaxID=1871021 RepID=UPI0026DAFA89|nr:MFS transporter [Lachnoclostridium phocaeense]